MTAPGVASLHAQESQQGNQLEEVTVTGIKYRPEDQTTATGLRLPLIDTPQSISVVTNEVLTLFNKQGAYDVADIVPGVSQGGEGFGSQDLFVRGQALQQGRVNGLQVNTYEWVDGFALDRLEIVRGPATVLYGVTGAFGGEINQILKQPQKDFHAEVGYKVGEFASHRYEADVTGAVPGTDDRLTGRLVGAYNNYGIFQDTVVDPNNINKMLSGTVAYAFTPATRGSVHGYIDKRAFDANDGCPVAQGANKTLYTPDIAPEHWYCGDPRQSKATVNIDIVGASLTHEFADGWTTEAKVGNSHTTRTLDYAFGFGPAGAYNLAPHDIYLYSYKIRDNQHVFTSDLSLGGKFNLLRRSQQFFLALEYEKSDSDRAHYQSFGLGTPNIFDMFTGGGKGILANGNPIPPIPPAVFTRDNSSDEKDLRASLQFLLNPLNRLDVLAGVLVQHTDLSEARQPATAAPPAGINETDTVYRGGITYGLVANKGNYLTDARTYFSYSEGFRPNVGVFDAAGNPLTNPQRMKSYEIGLKTDWLNGRVDANLAAYHSYVTNVVATIYGNVGTAGATFSSTLNGKNTYDGVEMEVLGEVVKGWNVALSFTHLKATVDSLLLHQDLSVANVPKDQASLFTSYEVLSGPFRGFLIGSSVVRKRDVPLSDNAAFFFNGYNPNNQLPYDITKADFVASYRVFGGPLTGLQLSVNVLNAFNGRSWYELGGSPGFSNSVGPPRAVTVGFRYMF